MILFPGFADTGGSWGSCVYADHLKLASYCHVTSNVSRIVVGYCAAGASPR